MKNSKKASRFALAVDFGSTYTKVKAFDLADYLFLGSGSSPTTLDEGIMTGLEAAIADLEARLKRPFQPDLRMACSSAAGGLRMITIGLVPSLTVQAAKYAALGAGAKIVGVYSGELNRKEVGQIELLAPDIILLCGGTDSGNQNVIIANAKQLSESTNGSPIIVAGNKSAADKIENIFRCAQKDFVVTDNVMPELGVLNIDGVQESIRKWFLDKIIRAKGLDAAQKFMNGNLIPTPSAVLQAAELISKGSKSEEGIGELVIVDIGGATTDIHSAAEGDPEEGGVIYRGFKEPFIKRTVEGDIGMRHCVEGIIQAAGLEGIAYSSGVVPSILQKYCSTLSDRCAYLPESPEQGRMDTALAKAAIELAIDRHAGKLTSAYTSSGEILIQKGKDLRNVSAVIGTGGAIAYHASPLALLQVTRFNARAPFSLRPKDPRFHVDRHYLLYAVGLIAQIDPVAALRVARRYITV